MLRRLLLALPALAVAIVLWAVLTAGWPQPVVVAQVVGGPTRGQSQLSWQISVRELAEGRSTPSPLRPLRLSASADGQRAVWTGRSDATGRAEARLEFAAPLAGAVSVRIEAPDSGALLGEGSVELDAARWVAGARRQGGWLPGQQAGEVWLRVAEAEGTLAVPFASELLIEASRGAPLTDGPRNGSGAGAQPAPGVRLELELVGAELTGAQPIRTDADGRARVGVRPLEHVIRLELRARSSEADGGAPLGNWFGALPVTPGALHASLQGEELWVRSPIPRDEAYVSLVDSAGRLAGYSLELQPDAEGGAGARVALGSELAGRARSGDVLAVVSSEPDRRSASAVGWPLHASADGAPALTFDVADQLLLDGSAGVLERERKRRGERRDLAALLLCAVGGLMLATFALELRRALRPPRGAEAAALGLVLASQRWWLLLAGGCLLLGLGSLAYFALLQR